MKIKNLPCAMSAILICMLTFSCNKNEDYVNYDLLVGHEWKLNAVKIDGIDMTNNCELDDTFILENKSEFDEKFGTDTCDDNNTSLNPNCWELQNNFSTLKLQYKIKVNGRNQKSIRYWDIIQLDDSTLIIKDQLAEDNGNPVRVLEYKN